MSDTDYYSQVCICGHVRDEHGESGACTIDDCLCGCFDLDTREDDDDDEA